MRIVIAFVVVLSLLCVASPAKADHRGGARLGHRAAKAAKAAKAVSHLRPPRLLRRCG